MAYVALAKIKKNSPPAALTSDITNSTGTFPVDHLEYFRDADGALILDGIVIWDPADSDPTHREEVTITGASGTTGAGNLTGGTRGVNADGTNGAARAFSSGAKIAVQFTTGKINQIAGNFAAHETAIAGKAASSHTHVESDVTGLTADLAAKAIGAASSTAGHLAVFSGTDGKTLADGGAVPSGGALFWTALGTPTYASSSTFTLVGDQTATLYTGRALKYTISGVVYPGCVVSATYSSPNTTVTVRGWPLTSNLTAVSYGDDSRTGTVTFIIPGYYEPSTTAATMLNDRVRLASGFTWALPPAHIIGLNLQHITNDGSTAPNVNGVVNSNLLSTSNSNAGPAMSSTSLISTGVDLNTTLANILISTGQKLEVKVTTNSSSSYQNATDLTVTFIWVNIS